MGAGHETTTAGHGPADRATEILKSVMLLASEIALDLEMTSDETRELFAATLFERAEVRHESAANTAAALATTLRTVQNYRKRRQEAPSPHLFNMRRRVLHMLDGGPADLPAIEKRLPPGSDMSYAKSALRSLIKDGLVVKDKRLGMYRRTNPDFQPWYLRTEVFPGRALELFFEHMARHVGSRFTPKLEEGSTPASMCAVMANIPESRLRDYADEFYGVMAEFDARWTKIDDEASDDEPRVFVGCEAIFGRLGPAVDGRSMQQLGEFATGPLWDTSIWTERKVLPEERD